MAFTVVELEDLIRILREQPRWREELLRWLLSEEFLTLPRTVQGLAEAQRRTEEELARLREEVRRLAEGQARLWEEVRRLTEAQRRTEEEVARLWEEVRRLTEGQARLWEEVRRLTEAQRRTEEELKELVAAQRRTQQQVDWLIGEVGLLRGRDLERHYREHAPAYFSPLLRRLKVLGPDQVAEVIDEAEDKGILSPEEARTIGLTDVLLRGIWREDGQEAYLVVEASVGLGEDDVRRARERADLLGRTGRRAFAAVAGERISAQVEALARSLQVRVFLDGKLIPP